MVSVFATFTTITSYVVSTFSLCSAGRLAGCAIRTARSLRSRGLFFGTGARTCRAFLHSTSSFVTGPSTRGTVGLGATYACTILFSNRGARSTVDTCKGSLIYCRSSPGSRTLTTRVIRTRIATVRTVRRRLDAAVHSGIPRWRRLPRQALQFFSYTPFS